MDSEIKSVEERLKSFTCQLQTECGILERLVYKHKNQHRRCSHFQYILKVRRDLKLLKIANLDEVFESSFLVINGDRPKQKVQLLEGLKRRKCNSGRYNFLERLLGVTRLLSQIVEPLLKAAIEISTLLARSFFMKFSLAVLAVLARVRVLVQQMLLDAVLLYNTVSSLSRREQSIKLKHEGLEVFREYYPRKEEARVLLECIWQKDKFVLVEKIHKIETTSQDRADQGNSPPNARQILYDNIEVLLGVGESGATASKHPATETIKVQEDCSDAGLKKHENNVPEASYTTLSSSEDGMISQLPASSSTCPMKKEAKKKVAFVAVKQPTPSTADQSRLHMQGTDRNDKKDPLLGLLTGRDKSKSSLF